MRRILHYLVPIVLTGISAIFGAIIAENVWLHAVSPEWVMEHVHPDVDRFLIEHSFDIGWIAGGLLFLIFFWQGARSKSDKNMEDHLINHDQ